MSKEGNKGAKTQLQPGYNPATNQQDYATTDSDFRPVDDSIARHEHQGESDGDIEDLKVDVDHELGDSSNVDDRVMVRGAHRDLYAAGKKHHQATQWGWSHRLDIAKTLVRGT